MPNENGSAYGLTAIFPVKNGTFECTHDVSHPYDIAYIENLRHYLANMPQAGGGPFSRAPITHFSRFVVLDKIGQTLVIAVCGILDPATFEDIERRTGANLSLYVSTNGQVKSAIQKNFPESVDGGNGEP